VLGVRGEMGEDGIPKRLWAWSEVVVGSMAIPV
jgi:hypothetical protein